MPNFLVRVTGTACVWKDVPIEADSPEEALRMIRQCDFPNDMPDIAEHSVPWEFSEGGNGVNDWSATGEVMDQDGEALMEDGELLERAEEPHA